ncbi:hypothetical protein PG988_013289 [Apiospora saccharicola]
MPLRAQEIFGKERLQAVDFVALPSIPQSMRHWINYLDVITVMPDGMSSLRRVRNRGNNSAFNSQQGYTPGHGPFHYQVARRLDHVMNFRLVNVVQNQAPTLGSSVNGNQYMDQAIELRQGLDLLDFALQGLNRAWPLSQGLPMWLCASLRCDNCRLRINLRGFRSKASTQVLCSACRRYLLRNCLLPDSIEVRRRRALGFANDDARVVVPTERRRAVTYPRFVQFKFPKVPTPPCTSCGSVGYRNWHQSNPGQPDERLLCYECYCFQQSFWRPYNTTRKLVLGREPTDREWRRVLNEKESKSAFPHETLLIVQLLRFGNQPFVICGIRGLVDWSHITSLDGTTCDICSFCRRESRYSDGGAASVQEHLAKRYTTQTALFRDLLRSSRPRME